MSNIGRGLEKLGFTKDDYLLEDYSDGKGIIITWQSDKAQPSDAEIKTAGDEWQTRWDIQADINRLESAITSRRYREAIAGTDGGWMANQESLIATERGKL